MAVREVDKSLVRETRIWFDWAVAVLGVADANILSLATVLGTSTTTSLIGMIGAKGAAEINVPMRNQCRDAMVIALNIGVLTNTNVAAADTVAGMRALWNTADSSLSATLTEFKRAPYPVGHAQPLA